jgi:hypothetical protein
MSKWSINLHNGSQNHIKDWKRRAAEQIELEDHAYYFLLTPRFGAIEFVARGYTANQE